MTAQHAQLRADDAPNSVAQQARAISERTVWSMEVKLLIFFGTMLFGVGGWVALNNYRLTAVEVALARISSDLKADVKSLLDPLQSDFKAMAQSVTVIGNQVSEIRGQLRGTRESSPTASYLRDSPSYSADRIPK